MEGLKQRGLPYAIPAHNQIDPPQIRDLQVIEAPEV